MIKFTLRQIEIFHAIAQVGHMTQASQKIGLTQSATSMALSELESQIGHRLFERKGRNLVLSQVGQLFLAECETLIAQARRLEQITVTDAEALTGKLIIAASSTIGNFILPRYLLFFKKLFPLVELELKVTNSHEALEQLKNWQCDLCFIEGPCSDTKINIQKWLEDELVIFARRDHDLMRQKKLNMDACLKFPWLLREEGSGTLALIHQTMLKKNLHPSTMMRVGSSLSIAAMVAKSDAISILSKFIVESEVFSEQLSVLPVPQWKCSRQLSFCQLPSRQGDLLVQHFLRCIATIDA